MTSATLDKPVSKFSADIDPSILNIDSTDDINDVADRADLSYYYTAGSFQFILEQSFKPETLENTDLTKVPFLPEWYEGIMSIHGLIVPVIDIQKFAKTQNVDVVENDSIARKYLLKLEHAEHQPIVIKIDEIPQMINTKQLDEVRAEKNAPEWIKNYLKNDTIKLAALDHSKLFEQLITQQ